MMRIAIAGLLASLVACAASVPRDPFSPGRATDARLAAAAVEAGFEAVEARVEGPASVRSNIPFHTVDYASDRLEFLRKRYRLEEVVAGAPDEWAAQLRLKEWVFKQIPGGNPKVRAVTAKAILDHAASGQTFYCTHYAITYTECALALGWQARKIGVDRPHGKVYGESTHHGVSEVWSNRFAKWVVIDPQSNLHFEADGEPLGGWEIRRAWLKESGSGVNHVVGVAPREQLKNPAINWWDKPEDETSAYFWLYVTDHAVNASSGSANRYIFPQDEANESLTWYQSDHAKKQPRLHTGYLKKRFIPTKRLGDAYWTVGIVEVTVAEAEASRLILSLDTYRPDLVRYEFSTGQGWKRVENPARVEWPLRRGDNILRFRTLGPRGQPGAEKVLRLRPA